MYHEIDLLSSEFIMLVISREQVLAWQWTLLIWEKTTRP
jgi:hypothetical protein